MLNMTGVMEQVCSNSFLYWYSRYYFYRRCRRSIIRVQPLSVFPRIGHGIMISIYGCSTIRQNRPIILILTYNTCVIEHIVHQGRINRITSGKPRTDICQYFC